MIWKVQPIFCEYLWYILKRSPAKMEASSPPVPARISRILFLESFGSRGISISFKMDSISSFLGVNSSNSILAISRNSSSFSVDKTDLADSILESTFSYAENCTIILSKSLYSLLSVLYFLRSETTSGCVICCATSLYLSLIPSNLSIIIYEKIPGLG